MPESYSVRVPAAIAKAERLTAAEGIAMQDGRTMVVYQSRPKTHGGRYVTITKSEVALAKALWEEHEFERMKLYGGIAQPPHPALIAFCEKVEAVDAS